CHRVVRGDGDPGGYRWGVARKRLLLEQERSEAQRAERRVLRDLIDAIGGGTPGPVASEGPLASKQVRAGRYEIDRVLGAGGMGVVYAARDLELDEIVALKLLRAPSGSEDAAALDRFRHEVRITRRISHAHVVRTHDIGEAAGRRFITMEYVDGWSLAQLLELRGTLPRCGSAARAARRIRRRHRNPCSPGRSSGDHRSSPGRSATCSDPPCRPTAGTGPTRPRRSTTRLRRSSGAARPCRTRRRTTTFAALP